MIAIGGSQPWCDEFVVLDPFEVLNYFKNAECIVTDTFHGTVMSAKWNKKVAVLIRDSNSNKLGDLIQRLKLEQVRIDKPTDIPEILCRQIDYRACNQIIASGKKKAVDYLRNSLSNDTTF